MDALSQVEMHKDALTPKERAVYDIVAAHPDAVLGCSSMELARRFGVSQSAISRFCKKSGFEGYGEFRMGLHQSITLKRFNDEGDPQGNDPAGSLADLLRATRDSMDPEKVAKLVRRLSAANHVYVMGAGQSDAPARMLAHRLVEDSIPSHYVEWGRETETVHTMCDRDVIVMFSSKNPTFSNLFSTLSTVGQDRRPYIVLVTHSASHPNCGQCDEVVLLPTWASLGLPYYLEPQTSMIFFVMLLGLASAMTVSTR
jgi:DNA-binding MurR/RpiR family transcriptional regulator